MNNCSFTGRLTKEPETRTFDSGKKIATFTLAVDKQGRKGTDFLNFVAWNKIGETVLTYCKKGDMVGVTGSLETREYEKDGEKRRIYEINVSSVSFLERKKRDEEAEAQKEEPPLTPAEIDKATEYYQPSIDEDDSAMLPFSIE